MDGVGSYEHRASKLRTKLQSKVNAARDQEFASLSQGLSKDEFWKRYVKNQNDVIKFYKLYYPEYPDQLVDAIAKRVEQIVAKAQSGQRLNTTEMEYFTKKEGNTWDYEKEILDQQLAGKISIAAKKLEQLMNE